MASAPAREVPYCTIFLVVSALTAHTLVLVGNLSTAHMLHGLGKSTSGWSKVGTSLSDAMIRELDPAMHTVSEALTKAVGVTTKIEKGVDMVLSTSGAAADTALEAYNASAPDPLNLNAHKFRDDAVAKLKSVTGGMLAKVNELIDQFLEAIHPALEQIKKWLYSMGEKIQTAIEQFGTTIDRVQKLFDQVMAQLSAAAGANEEEMVYNTYTLFDTDNSGTLMVDDLQSVAKIYGVSALAGQKAGQLFEKYDSDGKGGLDPEEYTLFVNDPALPGIMSLVLRTYAKKLSTAGGQIRAAKMRDEAASATVQYLGLVCAKNLTRASWVAQALTNKSVPIQFTADVLREFAMNMDDPNALSLVDIGGAMVGEMMKLDPSYVVEALKLMSSPAFWESEGFVAAEHAIAVKRVVSWIVKTPQGPAALRASLKMKPDAVEENLPEAAYKVTQVRQSRYAAQHRMGKANDDNAMYKSKAAQVLREGLLGGVGAAAADDNPEATAAVSRGVPARPETLQFASWLANNATDRADEYVQDCFDYSGESSGVLESFANQVNGMIKKIQSFMNTMKKYASQKGIDRLLREARGFATDALLDITKVVEGHVEAQLNKARCAVLEGAGVEGAGAVGPFGPCNATSAEDMPVVLTGAFEFVGSTLAQLKSVLPVVVQDLKFAKREVSAVSTGLKSVMETLGGKAPPIFYQVSSLYKAMWVAYFCFYGLLTVGILFYGFWASGWYGGPKAAAAEEYEGPRGFADRCRVCCASCNACLKGCHDSFLCFWSVLILMEVIVLVVFIIAVVICILGGLKVFMSAGCSQVYILGDNTVCTTALHMLRTFLGTFWSGVSSGISRLPIDETCHGDTLLTCHLISQEVSSSLKLSIIGGLLAAVLSFQMIIESAIMHERARWRRMFDAEAKKP